MGLFDSDFTYGGTAALGRPSGFWDNVAQGYEQVYRVDSQLALESEVRALWEENLDRLAARGVDIGNTRSSTFTSLYLQSYNDEELLNREAPLPKPLADFKRVNQQLKELGDPELKSFEQIVQEVAEMQREVEERSGLMAQTGGLSGVIGQFIGGIAGSVSFRDPLGLATLPFGGVGKSLLTRVLTGAATQGAIAGVTEIGFVEPARELAGLPERDPTFTIAASAVAGGVFEGAGTLIGRLLESRAARRAASQEAITAVQMDRQAAEAQLRAAISQLTDPDSRAVTHILDMENAVISRSPYGTGRAGLARFTAELEDVRGIYAGKPDVRPPPPETLPELVEKAADFQIIRERDPELYGKLEAAQERVNVARQEADAAEASIPTLEDAIADIDPETGALVRSYLDDLEQPGLTAQKRQEIEGKLARITETLDEARIAERQADLSIGPRKQVQARRKALQAANKNYKRVYAEVEAARAKMQREFEQQEIVERLRFGRDLGTAAVQTGAPIPPVRVNGDVAEAVGSKITSLDPDLELEGRSLVTSLGEIPDEVDLGGIKVNTSMKFLDAEGKEVTVREALEDLIEDLKLEEAMRSCAL